MLGSGRSKVPPGHSSLCSVSETVPSTLPPSQCPLTLARASLMPPVSRTERPKVTMLVISPLYRSLCPVSPGTVLKNSSPQLALPVWPAGHVAKAGAPADAERELFSSSRGEVSDPGYCREHTS